MNTQPDLNVHSLQVHETPTAVNNLMTTKKVLRFHVGTHGPFTREYTPASTGTAVAMKTDITQQVDELRSLHAHQPGATA